MEEIDQVVDFNRVLRAKAAKRYEATEARRRLLQAGKIKASDVTAEEFALFAEMDRIEAGDG